MKLKICGIRTQEMLDFCQENQIDFCGFNFVPTSRRKIDPHFFMPQGFKPKKVGIFMNQPFEAVCDILGKFDLDIVQFHGNEDAIYLQKTKEMFLGLKIWKVLSIDSDFEIMIMQDYCKNVDKVLFDSKIPGTGSLILSEFEGKLKQAIDFCETTNIPYGIAGGINARNIMEFKQRFPNADFLDTASGVEKNNKFDINTAQKLVGNFTHQGKHQRE